MEILIMNSRLYYSMRERLGPERNKELESEKAETRQKENSIE